MWAIIILIVGVILILVIRHFNYIHSIEKDVDKRKREIEAKALLDTQDLQKRLQELEKELHEKEEALKLIQESIRLKEENGLKVIEKSLELAGAQAVFRMDNILEAYNNYKASYLKTQNELNLTLAQLKERVNKINELSKVKLEEKEYNDFHRIILSDEAKEDIEILKDAASRLHSQVGLNKIIWENYIKKPFNIMIKNVLNNEEFSGIYKITNLKTNESYIGKSANIKTRFKTHVQTALGLGSAPTSVLYMKLIEYGIDNFKFEIIEKAPKEKLNELEKFYINFYDTVVYGYNEKVG